ncbi:hypothetical protein ES319_A10G177400v1 [Gossypium barbadense]|uniref:Transmembrane protein n=2 Tax=Gossypium TaxID=3633 RepID=A0A5J5U539_GOSBA|nr:hypothetical protein ES319_A10G177400v1 [Gossypium barbadense]TYG99475.1 hypothetical protein ES288_A10G198200v1 [Gossypium darwinii]
MREDGLLAPFQGAFEAPTFKPPRTSKPPVPRPLLALFWHRKKGFRRQKGVRGMEGRWWHAGKVLREVANGWPSMRRLKARWLVFFFVCLLKMLISSGLGLVWACWVLIVWVIWIWFRELGPDICKNRL